MANIWDEVQPQPNPKNVPLIPPGTNIWDDNAVKSEYRQAPPQQPVDLNKFLMEKVAPVIKPAIAPTLGMMAGGPIGAGLAGTTGLITGEALGGLAGEGYNQISGVTEPSVKNLALAAATGPAFRLLTGTGKLALQSGRSLAERLNEEGYQSAKSAVSALPVTAKGDIPGLFQSALSSSEPVLMPTNAEKEVYSQFNKLTADPNIKTRPTDVIGILDEYKKLFTHELTGETKPVSIPEMQGMLENLGSKMQEFEGNSKGALTQVWKALHKDLEAAAAANPQAAELLKARTASMRSRAIDTLMNEVENANKLNRGQEVEQFNANTALKKITDNPFYEKAFSKKEQSQIEKMLMDLNRIPALKPGAGAMYGSGANFLQNALVAGGATAMATGNLPGAGLIAAGASINLYKNIATIFKAQGGPAVWEALSKNGVLNPTTINTAAKLFEATGKSPFGASQSGSALVPAFDTITGERKKNANTQP